jgi:hypothetical protein
MVGLFSDALEHMRLGDELGSKQLGWHHPSAQWVRDCERLVRLDSRVADVLKGNLTPGPIEEWLEYHDVCQLKIALVPRRETLDALPHEKRIHWHKLLADAEAFQNKSQAVFRSIYDSSPELTATDREHLHKVKLTARKTYVIELRSSAFDSFVRLLAADGTTLAENDDILLGVNLNSRLVFRPKGDGVYRIVAGAFENSGIGKYTLTVREFVPDSPSKAELNGPCLEESEGGSGPRK